MRLFNAFYIDDFHTLGEPGEGDSAHFHTNVLGYVKWFAMLASSLEISKIRKHFVEDATNVGSIRHKSVEISTTRIDRSLSTAPNNSSHSVLSLSTSTKDLLRY